jgi:hypothetical protein
MPTDFAAYYLTQPLGLMVQAGLFVLPLLVLRFVFPNAFARLGFRRLFFGHLAVAVGVFALSAYAAISIGRSKLELGHIQQSEFYSWVAGNSVYLFVLAYVLALAFASLVLVPLSIWLSRSGRASVVIFAALGIALALCLGLLSVAFPGNEWGRTHPLELFASTLSSFGFATLVVCVAFAVGASLPFRKQGANSAT